MASAAFFFLSNRFRDKSVGRSLLMYESRTSYAIGHIRQDGRSIGVQRINVCLIGGYIYARVDYSRCTRDRLEV